MAAKKDGPDLNSMSVAELEQALLRDEAVLKKKEFISRLPDRGKKLELAVEHLKTLIAEKKSSQLRPGVDRKTQDLLAALEWGSKPEEHMKNGKNESEEDDEENGVSEDPDKTLRLLASVCRPLEQKKTTKVVKDDVMEELSAAFQKAIKIDEASRRPPSRPKFKPNVIPEDKRKSVKDTDGRKPEVKKIVAISLEESISAHRESEERLRREERRRASMRLADMQAPKEEILPVQQSQVVEELDEEEYVSFHDYREPKDDYGDDESDDD